MDGMNKEKWQAMTKEQKREHIWEYYKLPIIAVLCVIALAAWFIYEKVTYVEPVMGVVMTDVFTRQEDDSCFHEFLERAGYKVYDGAVNMQQNLRFYMDKENISHLMDNGNNYNALMGMFSVQEYDLIFSQPKVFATCAIEGAMMDLSTVLPAELLEKHKDRLLFSDEDGTVTAYPCGVNLMGNPWIEEHDLYKEGYVGIMKNTSDPELAAAFITYFLDQFEELEGE